MRILILAVGRAGAGPERDLFEHYRGRSRWPIALKEVEERGRLAPEELRRREAGKLLAALPRRAASLRIVALDEHGDDLASEAFARRLGAWRDEGVAEAAFLIGGSHGLDAAARERADLVLALGRMTWPHLMVRGLLAEQIYRAQQILAGHPYHRA